MAMSDKHPGDGKSTSWTLKFPVVGQTPTIFLNGEVKTIGQKGIDIGKDFYYALGSKSLAQDSSGTILQSNIDIFTISYTCQVKKEVVRNKTGQFPGKTAQTQKQPPTGGSPIT